MVRFQNGAISKWRPVKKAPLTNGALCHFLLDFGARKNGKAPFWRPKMEPQGAKMARMAPMGAKMAPFEKMAPFQNGVLSKWRPSKMAPLLKWRPFKMAPFQNGAPS